MPPAYTAQQKAAINEFVGITQSDKTGASKLLKQFAWNVQAAVNAYFSNPTSSNPNTTALHASLTKIFDKYRDEPKDLPNEIGPGGTQNLLDAMQISLEDIGALIFSEIVACPSLGRILREDFVSGWSDLSIDTLPKMRNVILQRRASLPTDKEVFKSVYNHTFILGLAPGAKTLLLEVAAELWKTMFTEPSFEWRGIAQGTPWLEWWLEFQEAKQTKAVNKDLWRQTLNFARASAEDEALRFWNEESSWPSVIDEFVEWVKTEKRPSGGGEAMEVE